MSNRAKAVSSPKISPVRALASSVLPTPVGPTKKKTPLGLPARAVTSDMLMPTRADEQHAHDRLDGAAGR